MSSEAASHEEGEDGASTTNPAANNNNTIGESGSSSSFGTPSPPASPPASEETATETDTVDDWAPLTASELWSLGLLAMPPEATDLGLAHFRNDVANTVALASKALPQANVSEALVAHLLDVQRFVEVNAVLAVADWRPAASSSAIPLLVPGLVDVVHEDEPGTLRSWYYLDAVAFTIPASAIVNSPSVRGERDDVEERGAEGEVPEVDVMAAVGLAVRQVGRRACFVAVVDDLRGGTRTTRTARVVAALRDAGGVAPEHCVVLPAAPMGSMEGNREASGVSTHRDEGGKREGEGDDSPGLDAWIGGVTKALLRRHARRLSVRKDEYLELRATVMFWAQLAGLSTEPGRSDKASTAAQTVGGLLIAAVKGNASLGFVGAHELAVGHRQTNPDSDPSKMWRIIHSSIALSMTSGFVLGFGGFITLPITAPVAYVAALVIRFRISLAISQLAGWSVLSPTAAGVTLLCTFGANGEHLLKPRYPPPKGASRKPANPSRVGSASELTAMSEGSGGTSGSASEDEHGSSEHCGDGEKERLLDASWFVRDVAPPRTSGDTESTLTSASSSLSLTDSAYDALHQLTPAGAFEEAERRAWVVSRRVHRALEGHPWREHLSRVAYERRLPVAITEVLGQLMTRNTSMSTVAYSAELVPVVGSVVSDVADGVLTERAASAALRTFFPEHFRSPATATAKGKGSGWGVFAGAGSDDDKAKVQNGATIGGFGSGIATVAKQAGESVTDAAKRAGESVSDVAKRASESVTDVAKQSWSVSRQASESLNEAAVQSWEVSKKAGEKVGEATKHVAANVTRSLAGPWWSAKHDATLVNDAASVPTAAAVEESSPSVDPASRRGGRFGLFGRVRGGLTAIGNGAKKGWAAIGDGARHTVTTVTMQSTKAVDVVLMAGGGKEVSDGSGVTVHAPAASEEAASEADLTDAVVMKGGDELRVAVIEAQASSVDALD